jgi:class 3 adenylate cyclase
MTLKPTSGLRRMDFVSEVVSSDEKSNTMQMRFLPDPRRYTEIQRDGKTLHLDKYLDEIVSLEDMAEAMREGRRPDPGLPIYHLPSSIDSTPDYAADRRIAIKQEIESGTYSPPRQRPLAHRTFDSNTNDRNIAFVSVDICGATALRRAQPEQFDQAYAIFIRELGTLVGQFNGSILKTKGDGFIALVDHPSFTSQCDATIDLGISLLVFLRDSLNPNLDAAGLPTLTIRVGADFGEASVRTFTIPMTGFSATEIASDALNRAVKIEEACSPGEFWIGRALYELIHVQWLERAAEADFAGESVGITGYQAYRVG